MSIIDDISSGIIPFDSNRALNALTDVLGPHLITGAGEVSKLVLLTSALNPIYIGLLFIILAYIGVGGVVNSAMEGRFLGRWSSVGVPSMFILCIVLLSPVPSQSGATLGQVVFIKSVKFGSNLADYMLKAYMDKHTVDPAGNTITYSLYRKQLEQVNTQMKVALQQYVCGEQLKTMGYGSTVNYFVLLNEVCGLPADIIGNEQYGYFNYYTLGNDQAIQNINNSIAQLRTFTGVQDLPSQGKYDTANVKTSQKLSQASAQLGCYLTQFKKRMSTPLDANIARSAKLATKSPISAAPSVGSVSIQQINNNMLTLNQEAMGAVWAPALYDSYKCIMNDALGGQQKTEVSIDKSALSKNAPWREGWVSAALVINDDVQAYDKANAAAALPLSFETFKPPQYERLGDTLMDKQNIGFLLKQLADMSFFITRENNYPSKAEAALSDVLTTSNGKAVEADWTRIAIGTVTFEALKQTALNVNTMDIKEAEKFARNSPKLASFLQSAIGQKLATSATAPGNMTKLVVLTGKWMHGILNKTMNVAETAESTASKIPVLGAIVSAVKGAATVTLPNPTILKVLLVSLTLFNAVVLLPQLMLLLVMLVWMVRTAVWFMIIPLATVLIALPNTRVGHDIWKSALGIVITPALALLFYLISINVFDTMYGALFSWVFEPLFHSFQNGALSFGMELLTQIVGGEVFFRIFLAIGVAVMSNLYLGMLIVRGPDMVMGALGMRSSGDLGNELYDVRGNLNTMGDPTGKFTDASRVLR